ncbi:MAG: hypothetical protein IJ438_09175 [Clostridia bacterium]|nr:hypothetical protein [Clostridia bacterium]
MKKFLALLLAAMMLMSAVGVAMADGEDTSTVTYDKAATIEKIYTGALPVGDALSFEVEFVKEMATGSTDDPDLLSFPDHTVTATEDGSLTNKLTLNYRVPEDLAPGGYVYKLTEVSEKKSDNTANTNVTLDDKVVYVMISKLNDGTSSIAVCGKPTEESGVQTAADDLTDETKKDDFTNTYKTGAVDITKEFKGNAAVVTDTFKATVTFTTKENLDNFTVTVTPPGKTTGTESKLSIDDAGKAVLDVTIEKGTLNITGIPYGVTVNVKESSQSGFEDNMNGYTDTYTADVTVSETKQTITVTNTKDAVIPTGVYMDYIPYIVILAVAVIGLVAFVAKRRMSADRDD